MRAIPILAAFALFAGVTAARAQDVDWQKVDAALGRSAAVTEDVHRYGFPRSDLQVKVDNVALKPAFALGGWVAFKPVNGQVMVMGDLVLLASEVSPVMTKLLDGGVEITGLHNHLLRAEPATVYMHVAAHGDPVKIATALRAALAESKTPLTAGAAAKAPALALDTMQLDKIVRAKGKENGGVYQFSVPRHAPIQDAGTKLTPPGPLGVATGINFQPTESGKAAVTGDFVLVADEVLPVTKTLRAAGIEVTAIHLHMLTEEPRLIFMHFWANGDAMSLARGLSAALDKTASDRG
jgi:hypothetical protein